MPQRYFRKDESLDRLADVMNVAQFVSFLPGNLKQAYSRVLGYAPNHRFSSLEQAVGVLMAKSPENSLNIRSFAPDDPQSHEFIYGVKDIHAVMAAVKRISSTGLHVIINETVDVRDGGVSGVVQGGVIEFSPDDTPRCVEKPGIASLYETWGTSLLSIVYGFPVDFGALKEERLEFTLHPKPRGWKNTHLLGWELEKIPHSEVYPSLSWPNNFSRMLGDKAYGLLFASVLGFCVPKTTVISRRVAPFTFGEDTGSSEYWIRTCPIEQVPGKFTTHKGWVDPFRLIATEDPEGTNIASVVSQRSVSVEFSGASIMGGDGIPIIEGVKGEGEAFMKGAVPPQILPRRIIEDVASLHSVVSQRVGPVRFEWVHDGQRVWIVQLHTGLTSTKGNELVPGKPQRWREFDVNRGLEQLRTLLSELAGDEGIVLIGQVGVTSHIADVIRKAGKPARLERHRAVLA